MCACAQPCLHVARQECGIAISSDGPPRPPSESGHVAHAMDVHAMVIHIMDIHSVDIHSMVIHNMDVHKFIEIV